jgi:hypothetical protein
MLSDRTESMYKILNHTSWTCEGCIVISWSNDWSSHRPWIFSKEWVRPSNSGKIDQIWPKRLPKQLWRGSNLSYLLFGGSRPSILAKSGQIWPKVGQNCPKVGQNCPKVGQKVPKIGGAILNNILIAIPEKRSKIDALSTPQWIHNGSAMAKNTLHNRAEFSKNEGFSSIFEVFWLFFSKVIIHHTHHFMMYVKNLLILRSVEEFLTIPYRNYSVAVRTHQEEVIVSSEYDGSL